MRLVCPSCGAMHSLEAWENDRMAREAMGKMASLPAPVLSWALPYLALFRPYKKGLSWKKAGKLLDELVELTKGQVITWKGRKGRINQEIWARALEETVNSDVARPLKNHNYLKAVASDLAEKQTARTEAEMEEKRRYPYGRDLTAPGAVEQIRTEQRGLRTKENTNEELISMPPEFLEAIGKIGKKLPGGG